MTTFDPPDEPWRRQPPQTATEKLQEQIERSLKQANAMERQFGQAEALERPFRQWQEIQRATIQWDDAQRHLAPRRHLEQIEKLMRDTSLVRQIQEQERLSLSGHLKEILTQSVAPRHMQELFAHGSATSQAQRMLDQYLPKYQLSRASDAIRAAADFNTLASSINAYEKIFAATKRQEWFNTLQRHATGGVSLQEFARLHEQINPTLTAFEEAQRTLNALGTSFRDIDFDSVEFSEDEERETALATQEITREVGAEPSLQAAVEQIVAAIEAQKNPNVRAMLWLFFKKMLEWIISGIIGAIISQQMPQAPPANPPQAVKQLKVIARANVDSTSLLTEYRFVSAKSLVLRQNPKARSPALGTIGFCRVVKLLKKDKDFVLVLWKDAESGVEIQGWVFARYLEKFN